MATPIPPQVSLRVFREFRGMTLTDLAELIREQGCDISRDGLNNIELGRRSGSEPLMVAWCRALGIKRMQVRQASELIEWLEAAQAPEPARSAA